MNAATSHTTLPITNNSIDPAKSSQMISLTSNVMLFPNSLNQSVYQNIYRFRGTAFIRNQSLSHKNPI